MTIASAVGDGLASRVSAVEATARPKPVSSVRALTRHGAGKSLMLAEMAPSVAGWPAAKPNSAEAQRRHRHHAERDAQPVEDVLADEQLQQRRRAQPVTHGRARRRRRRGSGS